MRLNAFQIPDSGEQPEEQASGRGRGEERRGEETVGQSKMVAWLYLCVLSWVLSKR